jgi:glycosyltransferase involved in cell wall biosynthesis
MRPRVLIIAEAANPEWASVPLIGWELTCALREVADVHLVTQVRNRDAIARKEWIEGRDFTSIDNEGFAVPLLRLASIFRGGDGKGWTTISAFAALAYYSFETEVWRRFGPSLRGGQFDLVHRVTPVSPTCQSILAQRLKRERIPFVLGPLNGGVPWPRGFRHRQYAEREWLSHLRSLYKLLPGYTSTRTNSSAILVGSGFTRDDMPRSAQDKCIYLPENGINPHLFNKPRTGPAKLPLRGAFVGRLVPYKGADLLIRAAEPFLKSGTMFLEIIGDGPQRDELAELISSLDLGAWIRLHGWVPHDRIQDILRTCDFLGFPSVREFGGGVVLEAMALGLAPIVANYGGPAELVDDECGIRVPFDDEQNLVENFTKEFARIAQTPSLLDKLGAAAMNKVSEKYTWPKKAEQILTVYESLLAGASGAGAVTR